MKMRRYLGKVLYEIIPKNLHSKIHLKLQKKYQSK